MYPFEKNLTKLDRLVIVWSLALFVGTTSLAILAFTSYRVLGGFDGMMIGVGVTIPAVWMQAKILCQ